MNVRLANERLSRGALLLRAGALIGLALGAVALRTGIAAAYPFRASCGAVTGLPCIFCGATRALHHLLNGHWREALYFNWLAFPVAALGAIIALKLLVEVVGQRRVLTDLPELSVNRRSVAFGLTALVTLWLLQVSLAVSLHKRELLNPNGVLYRMFVSDAVVRLEK